jgi:GTP-binding protein
MEEAESDVALTVKINTKSSDEIATIYGRGDLHLAILIEKMRREGFEMSVTPPQVVTKRDPETKKLLEPMERVTVEVES